ncbi:MAG TPA: YitT family protein, partial [Clostridia bacterium]|nr:YitT family protein [Clostridia bacterium]
SFASAAQFAPGGIAGLSVIASHYTGLPIGVLTLLFNIPVILVSYRTLGKWFLFKSVKTMAFVTVLLDLVFPLLPAYSGDAIMAALFAGALSGAGLALIYRRGSSTGGTDFLIMSLRKKLPHVSIGTLSIITDGCVILLGGLAFGRIDAVLQGILMSVVATVLIDKITYRLTAGQLAVIVTGEGEKVAMRINADIERGVTSLEALGTFTGSARRVLICACSRAEAHRIRKLVYGIDAGALIMFCPYDAAYGLGFQPPTT